MNTSLKAVPASVAAISVNEFYGVFWKLLHLPRSDHGCRFTRNIGEHQRNAKTTHTEFIGLAISGGVDSMALASLCAQLAMNKPRLDDPVKQQINFNFRAFIVDHGVRTGSAEEAEAVKNVLHSRSERPRQEREIIMLIFQTFLRTSLKSDGRRTSNRGKHPISNLLQGHIDFRRWEKLAVVLTHKACFWRIMKTIKLRLCS